jgi:hypothetical protein
MNCTWNATPTTVKYCHSKQVMPRILLTFGIRNFNDDIPLDQKLYYNISGSGILLHGETKISDLQFLCGALACTEELTTLNMSVNSVMPHMAGTHNIKPFQKSFFTIQYIRR